MHYSQPVHQVSYVLSIWSQRARDRLPLWYGCLETAAGQRFDFETLNELNHLLCEVCGWTESLTDARRARVRKRHKQGQKLLISRVILPRRKTRNESQTVFQHNDFLRNEDRR